MYDATTTKIKKTASNAVLCAGMFILAQMGQNLHAQGANNTTSTTQLMGHIPVNALAGSRLLGHWDPAATIPLVLALPLRNQNELGGLLQSLYDPNDPLHGQFLAPSDFASRFGPTQEDYDAVVAYAVSQGLAITATHSNRALVEATGTTANVEGAFNVHLMHYQGADGRHFYAPDAEPSVPGALSGRLSNIVGLDSSGVRVPHYHKKPNVHANTTGSHGGSGPQGGLSPSDLRNAYEISSIPSQGTGQTLGVFELDGYLPSDIATYESTFGLPHVTLQNVLVDGYNGAAGDGADEVTLDIELQIAMAPSVSKIMVYEGPNSDAGVVATYARIAEDNLAKSISTCWGEYEAANTASILQSENASFQQMAAQGQSIFAASGDSGAYDSGSRRSLSVDDPASQPYVVGVGGTTLNTGSGGTYGSETVWDGGSIDNGASGGGISSVWALPSYQQGIASTASGASSSKRNVPDVALDADPDTGYSIFTGGQWEVFGGTSCATPLWAAFTALVNQKRSANGLSNVGFANPLIYQIAKSSHYSSDFHDITSGNNLYYPAVTGYDLATGWGSFKGLYLYDDLTSSSSGSPSPTPTPAPTPTPTPTPAPPSATAPANLTASALSAREIRLAWHNSTNASKIGIQYSTDGVHFSTIGYISGTLGAIYITGTSRNVTYSFRIFAIVKNSASGYSNVASATTP